MRLLPLAAALLASHAAAQGAPGYPAQTYTLDPAHSTVVFSLDHLGFSRFTATFDEIAGTLELDTAAPQEAQLSVTISTGSLDIPKPPEGFREMLLGPDWLDAEAHPEITYRSTAIIPDGEAATIEGLLTFRGTEQPVTLHATFNGAWPGPPYEPGPRLGFSATGTFLRSAFGMGQGVPPVGTQFGVSDTVTVRIETEWTGTIPPETPPETPPG
ncbi:YceI family protein [Oceaniglobus roseus]|uniref:YceI family protein n=1 Tax=Oceaniglobus roseus TaxID=1737570 RepID=UPI000C7ECFB0|nr:YceI family protein [Kandeliimicrobium roseum]